MFNLRNSLICWIDLVLLIAPTDLVELIDLIDLVDLLDLIDLNDLIDLIDISDRNGLMDVIGWIDLSAFAHSFLTYFFPLCHLRDYPQCSRHVHVAFCRAPLFQKPGRRDDLSRCSHFYPGEIGKRYDRNKYKMRQGIALKGMAFMWHFLVATLPSVLKLTFVSAPSNRGAPNDVVDLIDLIDSVDLIDLFDLIGDLIDLIYIFNLYY